MVSFGSRRRPTSGPISSPRGATLAAVGPTTTLGAAASSATIHTLINIATDYRAASYRWQHANVTSLHPAPAARRHFYDRRMQPTDELRGARRANPPADWRGVRPISTNWEVFEWMFGCVLPVVCFVFERDFGLFGGLTGLIYAFVGFEITLFAFWKLCPASNELPSALIAGALALGSCFAGLVGLVLLPMSM